MRTPIASLPVRRFSALAGLTFATVVIAGCGGSPDIGPGTSTTTTSTTTSSTTTTIPTFSGSIAVQGTPCSAPASGNVSCTFVANVIGGQSPFTFEWVFTNPANGQTVNATGQQVSPALGCGYSSGTSTFNVAIALTITATGGATTRVDSTQQVGRPAGNCGV
ncbi:MAG: hypothetical protein QM736_24305 [Vicinamibacterales bacterium]